MPQQFDDDFADQNGEELDLSSGEGGNDAPALPEDRGDELLPENGAKPQEAVEQQQKPQEAAEDQQAKPPTMIPKSRFDEVNQRKKELEARVEQLEAERSKGIDLGEDIGKLEEKYTELLLEGETQQANNLRMQINQKLLETSMQMVAQQAAQERQRSETQVAANNVMNSYPYLDTPEGELALRLIINERDRLIAAGTPPVAAIQQAADAIAPRFVPQNSAFHDRGTTTRGQMVDSRTKGAVSRGLQDSAKQPVAAQGVGNRAMPSLPSSVEDMDEDQFASLTKEQKRKLRGD